MEIKSAKFLTSSIDVSKAPPENLPEYVFIGRSNVGKSSLINVLTNRKELARTSSTPGKTQLINHFIINANWYLVDLPGYGYAQLSKEKKEGIQKMIYDYLLKRENLLCTFLLIDSRLPLQKKDAEFIEWLGEKGIPFVLVFTKTDKLSKTKLEQSTESVKNELLKSWEELPQLFYTSSAKKSGTKEILDFIEQSNKLFKKPAGYPSLPILEGD